MRVAWIVLRKSDGLIPAWYGAIQLRLDLREGADQEIFMHTYDPPLIRFIESICRIGDLVVDVGANAGVVSVTAANVVGATGLVASFEPNAELSTRLDIMSKNNPLKNIRVFPCALGDREDSLPLYVSSSHPYSSLDVEALPNYPLKTIADVPVRKLDSYLPALAEGRHFRLLKIDAQGYENRIVRGAIEVLNNTPPDFVLIEAYLSGLDDTIALLTSSGYHLYRFGGDTLLENCVRETIRAGDNLVFSRVSA